MRTLIIIASVLTLSFYSCNDEKKSNESNEVAANKTIAKDVDVNEFKNLVESGNGQIIDVRTPEEVTEGYIKGAENINIYDPNFEANISKLDKNKPVYVYCKSGGRSGNAMSKMEELGFMEVYNLEGGIGAWNNAGNVTVK